MTPAPSSDLARLRRTAKALRRLYPQSRFRVSMKYRDIFMIGQFAGLGCSFSQGLEGWEKAVEIALKARAA